MAHDVDVEDAHGFAYFFNKYWSEEQQVDLLCFKEPEGKLPPNFMVHSLGDVSTPPNEWSTPLIPFFHHSLPDPSFMLMPVDCWPISPVNVAEIEHGDRIIREGRADKIYLGNVHHLAHDGVPEGFGKGYSPFESPFVKNCQDSWYRLCLAPSLWKKKYFLKYLYPSISPWKYENGETRGSPHARSDGATVLSVYGAPGWGLYDFLHLRGRGSRKSARTDQSVPVTDPDDITKLREFGVPV
jgi:hypothetical protein